jgi:hypothetical protein
MAKKTTALADVGTGLSVIMKQNRARLRSKKRLSIALDPGMKGFKVSDR